MNKRKVLVIGWDAADWKAIDPLMDQGLMPNLEKLVNAGVRGRLATLDPPLSPMLWTSIATGKRPFKHGILGFSEVGPDGKTVRPVTNVHRKVKAIWNILNQEGARSNVLGWWPSHPAEPINGIMISNFYQRASRPINEPWVMRTGTVHPEAMSAHFAALRIHPAELTAAHIAPFVPDFLKVDQDKEKALESLSRIIADCSTVQAAATYIMEHEEWDFMGVYFDAIDHFAHGFMKYNPPRRDHVPEREYELYKGVMTAAYRFHDLMLGRLLDLAGEDTTVMLISDHGFHPDHLRPRAIPKEPAGPAYEHSPFGIFCIKGPGIKQDELIHGASLLDITPTLLTLFDLPVAQDMDGKPLLDIYTEPHELKVIPSWEDVDGESGMHVNVGAQEAFSDMDRESLQQLVELGYIDDPGADPDKATMKTVRENRYYLSRSFRDADMVDEAMEILRELFAEAPDQLRYGMDLARLLVRTQQLTEARAVLEKVTEERRTAHEKARAQAAEKPETPQLDPYVVEPSIRMMEASIFLAEGKAQQALAILERLETNPQLKDAVQMRLGGVHMKMNQWAKALSAYEKAIAYDPQNAGAYHGAGLAYLKNGDAAAAADQLHNALALRFNAPHVHYHLGEAYFKLDQLPEAAQAFTVCLRMSPGIERARRRLIAIHTQLGQHELAEELKQGTQVAPESEVITVVSGLPRSGTSMMMQALVAGGLVPFTDEERAADESNPKGYYEHNAVKGLAKDSRFLELAKGKVVKVVAPLLPFLPPRFSYRVVFMERDIHEVLGSQDSMLGRLAKKDPKAAFRVGLHDAYVKQLERVATWQKRQGNVQLIRVPYHSVVASAEEELAKVNTFFGNKLALESMVNAVDPSLYRTRSAAKSSATPDVETAGQ